MSQPPLPERKPPPAPIVAGSLLIGCMLLGGALGYGLGSLLGFAVLVGLVGLFAGLIAGFVLVYDRYRDL